MSSKRRFLNWRTIAVCWAWALTSTPAVAQDLTTYFRSRHTDIPLTVKSDYVAVRDQQHQLTQPSFLSTTERQHLAQLGVTLLPAAAVKSAPKNTQILGYPVWFDKKNGAVGILPPQIVVRLASDRWLGEIQRTNGFVEYKATNLRPGTYKVWYTTPDLALAAANKLANSPGVLFAHPNFMLPKDFRSAALRPHAGEPLFSQQWHLENTGQFGGMPHADIQVKAAWDVTKGTATTLVAVLDGGFQMTHPDLAESFAINAAEIPANHIDDDQNGYVDDVYGWNFGLQDNNLPGGGYIDHGTAVAGLVSARENGIGVTGVCPMCRIIPIAVAWEVAEDAAAFLYAERRGAQVISNSWGYPVGVPETDVVVDAIDEVARHGREDKGTIILFAMNNIDRNDCTGATPDISALDSVIAVSSSSDQDKKVSFSGWGLCMDLLSPSFDAGRKGITTTDLTAALGYNNGQRINDLTDPNYTSNFNGTSAATPIAAGVFALMLAAQNDLTRDEALALAVQTADKIDPERAAYHPQTGFSLKYGYGRINAAKAVAAASAFRRFTLGPGKGVQLRQ